MDFVGLHARHGLRVCFPTAQPVFVLRQPGRAQLTSATKLVRSHPHASTHTIAHRSTIYNGEPLPTAAVHSVVPAWQQSQPATRAERGFFSFWLPVLLVLCLALVSLAASVVMFVLYIRPVLKAAERAAAAAELAAVQMEVAAKEMEKAASVMANDLPVTLLEMEKTSKEFETLGRQLNRFTRILAQTPAEAVVSTTSTIQETTRSSFQKVVDDMSSLTNLQARSWIAKWRSRTVAAASAEEAGAPPVPPVPPRAPGDAGAGRQEFRVGAPWEQPPRKKGGEAGTVGVAAAAEGQQQGQGQEPTAGVANGAAASLNGSHSTPATLSPHGEGGGAQDGVGNSFQGMKAAVVAQLRARGGPSSEEERAAAAAVLAALDKAQRAAEEAALATGALEAAYDRAEAKGAIRARQGE